MTRGSYIKELRTKLGYTQVQLSKSLGYSQGTISGWESGMTVSDQAFGKIAKFAASKKVDIKGKVDEKKPQPAKPTKPASKPSAKPAAKPTAKSSAKPAPKSKPAVKASVKAKPAPKAKPAAKPAAKSGKGKK